MEWQRVTAGEFVGDVKKGDKVEVQVSPGVWVPATVVYDMDTRISVKLVTPILLIIKTHTITKGFFSQKETVDEEDTFTETWTSGRAYVRYPK